MSYDAANELLNLNSMTYSYDQNGNRIQKNETSGITTYTYDEENRLTKVEISGTPAQVITYAYDPFGRRIQKNVNGTITNYVYDRDAIILQYDQSGAVTARYTHGLGIDEPLAMEKSIQMYYYHADGLGSIVLLTSAGGSVAQRYDYDAFGNITSGAPPVTQPYTYTAREYDPETGLYFYRARYYDPKAGRFIQRDPIGFKGGINQYVYTGNNPVNRIDPFGLYTCVYSVKEHHMSCLPNNPANPTFDSYNFVSGRNDSPCPDSCQNNPDRENIRNRGPIPFGGYTIGSQLPDSSRRNLTPFSTNDMLDRSGFQTHGCSNTPTCSSGCIAATTNDTRDQFNNLMSREEGNNTLVVIPETSLW